MGLTSNIFLGRVREELKRRQSRLDREKAICAALEQLAGLLERESTPTVITDPSVLADGSALLANWPHPKTLHTFAKRTVIPRQPQFASGSVLDAVRSLLKERGPLHADELTKAIFAADSANFQRAKSSVVSELVKAVKRDEFKRIARNTYALPENDSEEAEEANP